MITEKLYILCTNCLNHIIEIDRETQISGCVNCGEEIHNPYYKGE